MLPFEVGKKGDDSDGDAVPLLAGAPPSSSSSNGGGATIEVKVKSSDMGEVSVTVPATATVDDLKAAVSRQLNIPPEKRVRLIAAGKLLDAGRLVDLKVVDGSFIHCVVSNPPPPPAPPSAPSSSSSSATNTSMLDDDEIFNNDIALAMNRSASRTGTGGGGGFWFDGGGSDPSLGTNRDFMWGVVMGYLLGAPCCLSLTSFPPPPVSRP